MGLLSRQVPSRTILPVALFVAAVALPGLLFAADGQGGRQPASIPLTLFWIALLLVLAKTSALIERVGQPAVLGEMLLGILLGSLPLIGIDFLEPIKTNEYLHFLAELGVVILLFQVGLESDVSTMMKVGLPSFAVACVGVILPLVFIGYVVGPLIEPGLGSSSYLFLGATMTATSVGITARVLKDLGKSDTPEARTILGAAVIDDVLGLIILAVVTAIVLTGTVSALSVVWIVVKAVVVLVGGVLFGIWMTPRVSAFFSKINAGTGMKFALVISFGLVFAYLSSLAGLAPIVGAFTAGLILTPVYFDRFMAQPVVEEIKVAIVEEKRTPFVDRIDGIIKTHSGKHIEVFTEHLGHFMVPIFFVLTGMQVKLATLNDLSIVGLAVGIFIVAVITKVAAGWAAGRGMHKLSVGVGMIPRGEVGLIFANLGKEIGVLNDAVFSAVVIVIMLTTLITPPLLAVVIRKVVAR